MSERFKVTKHDEPSGKNYKNYGATSAESDMELKGKLLPESGISVSLAVHKYNLKLRKHTFSMYGIHKFGPMEQLAWANTFM
ncbi:unnamed protein product [Pieris brassicae]|uniref:Uncharacterized protein n=1 Tax=Pieris brassicae TaxID=7116 RepID=A0A9P0TLF4_PIEBR|nr:unnamed protein product [Pieris brassicae]